MGLAYCNRNLTDGLIPKAVGRGQLRWNGGDLSPAIEELERLNMWVKDPIGWRVHDYDQYQPSKEDVEADREKARERKEKSRQKSGAVTPEVTPNSSRRSALPVPGPVPEPLPVPVPEVQELAPTSSSRARDPLFEALCESTGQDWHELSRTGRKAANVAAEDLRKLNATPDEVYRRAANYPTHFSDAALTPSALAKHWAQLARPGTAGTARLGPLDQLAMRTRKEVAREEAESKAASGTVGRSLPG